MLKNIAFYKTSFYIYILKLKFIALLNQLFLKNVFHGACLADDTYEGILIFGNPNSGKTLIIEDFIFQSNYKLISDDLIKISADKEDLFAYPINNKFLFIKKSSKVLKKKLAKNQISKAKVKINRIFVLDVNTDQKEAYFKSKIYNINRYKKLGMEKLLFKTHASTIKLLAKTSYQNIPQIQDA